MILKTIITFKLSSVSTVHVVAVDKVSQYALPICRYYPHRQIEEVLVGGVRCRDGMWMENSVGRGWRNTNMCHENLKGGESIDG